MGKRRDTSEAIDDLLYALSIGALTGAVFVAPNAFVMLERPLSKVFDGLDMRQKQRKVSRLRSYMKTQGLVRGDYDHGITLTAKARRRLKTRAFEKLTIHQPPAWDGRWRIVMFDIPEVQREARRLFASKIQELGFQLLQQSVWIHPFACHDVIASVAGHYGVAQWVTYIETDRIDAEEKLLRRFKKILSNCRHV